MIEWVEVLFMKRIWNGRAFISHDGCVPLGKAVSDEFRTRQILTGNRFIESNAEHCKWNVTSEVGLGNCSMCGTFVFLQVLGIKLSFVPGQIRAPLGTR